MNQAGVVLDPAGIAIAATANNERSPSIAFDGTNYLVVWEDYRRGEPDIFSARVSQSGTVLDPDGIAISIDIGDQYDPLVAFDGTNYLVVWENQYDWLSDEKGENLMDFIYKVEEFENAIHEIEKLTNGRIKLRSVNRNNNPFSQSKKYRDLYNENTRKMIGKRFEKDIDIFKYTF